jgi:ubiquinone biosynthesis protein Coq4
MPTLVPHRPLRRNWPLFLADVARFAVRQGSAHYELVEATMALAGPAMEPHYQAFVADPAGRRLLEERPDLASVLGDRDALAAMSPDSLGRAYLAFISEYRFDAKAFEAMTSFDRMAERLDWDEDFVFVINRGAQIHDLWHVLGGWGPDLAGEMAVMSFTNTIVPNPGIGLQLVAIPALARNAPISRAQWRRIRFEAETQALRSHGMLTAPYEELLALPLAEVRARLGLLPPSDAHPVGVPFVSWTSIPAVAWMERRSPTMEQAA